MNDDKQGMDIVAKFDQLDATFSNLAKLMGSYYQELIKAGVPYQLACDLVIDAHRILLEQK